MTELLCRIGPCIILVTLNILMIRDFKKSIKRRSNLKNTHYKDKRNKAYRWKSHVQYQYKNTGMYDLYCNVKNVVFAQII